MPRLPKRILLIRHGQSLGNVDSSQYGLLGDIHVPLTHYGWKQAYSAGITLKEMIPEEEKSYFFVSPYVRAHETLRGVALGFKGGIKNIQWSEDIRLREHEKGFQNQVISKEMYAARRSLEQKHGRFFYRWPHGESLADVWDRLYSFRESLRRFIRVNEHIDNIVVVSHNHFILNFLLHTLKLGPDDYTKFKPLPNCAVCILEPTSRTTSKRVLSAFTFTTLVDPSTRKVYKGKEPPRENDTSKWGKCRVVREPPANLSRL